MRVMLRIFSSANPETHFRNCMQSPFFYSPLTKSFNSSILLPEFHISCWFTDTQSHCVLTLNEICLQQNGRSVILGPYPPLKSEVSLKSMSWVEVEECLETWHLCEIVWERAFMCEMWIVSRHPIKALQTFSEQRIACEDHLALGRCCYVMAVFIAALCAKPAKCTCSELYHGKIAKNLVWIGLFSANLSLLSAQLVQNRVNFRGVICSCAIGRATVKN